jgi:hypothetical protein
VAVLRGDRHGRIEEIGVDPDQSILTASKRRSRQVPCPVGHAPLRADGISDLAQGQIQRRERPGKAANDRAGIEVIAVTRIHKRNPDTGIGEQHSVRFPVFATQLSGVATEIERPDLVQQPLDLIAHRSWPETSRVWRAICAN